MRKTVLLALALSAALTGSAQVLNVSSIDRVSLPENMGNQVAAISPQGDFLLITDAANKGLTKVDLTTGQSTVITDALGAGFDAMISADGSQVVYRENTFTPDHLRMVSLKSQKLATGERHTLVEPTRDLQGYHLENAIKDNATEDVAVINGGKKQMRSFDGSALNRDNVRPVLSIANRQLMITRNGRTEVFSPNGTEGRSYLWASLSPDGTKVLYYLAANGAFVCDLNGQNIVYIGALRAPQWYGNNVIVGMNDADDGQFIISSSIVAADLNGNQQTLTDANVIAMYPQTCEKAGKIAFSTPAGEAYIINLK